jgi:PAS domain S-box-containing protein
MAYETEHPGTLAGEHTSPSMRRALGVCCVAYTLATLAVLPLAHLPGPVVPAVTTTFGAGVLIADLCTSFLLLVQFRVAPSWPMLLLAAAYFYSGAMACLHVLAFPGAWIPDTVLVGTPQSVGWLFICWILGYPTLILTAIVAEARFRHRRIAAEGVHHAIATVFGLVLAVLVALTLVATTGPSWLPQQLQGQVFTSWSTTAQWTSVGLTMAAFVALALVTRGRNVLYGWLGLALIAFMAFNVLAVAGGARHTIGWDLSRISGFISAIVLLVFFLGQFAKLHRSLAQALQHIRHQAEQALSDSHARMHAICDTALDGIITMDHAGQIADFNQAAEQIFGYRRSDVMGQALADVVIPPALREAHRRGLARYLATGDAAVLGTRIEVTGLRADGSLVDLELSINRLPGDGPPLFAGFVRDITERKRAEAALRESQAHYRALAESLPHLVWTCRPDGSCDYLSRQWVAYTGRPAPEQLGYGWADHLHPEDRERVLAAWAEATAHGDQFDTECRLRRADGVYRWFKTRAVPLRDTAGRLVKWFGSNTDFEDYHQTAHRLQAQVERLHVLEQITRAIGEHQDPHSIFQVVIRRLEEHLPLDFGCLCLYDVAHAALTVTCVGRQSQPLALELALPEHAHIAIDQNGLSRCVQGQLVYEPDLRQVPCPFPQRLARGGLGALVVAPLLVENTVFGVLVAARRAANSFSSGEWEFLKQVSEHVALATHQAQLYGALQQAYDDLRQTQQAVMQQERLRVLGQMASGITHDMNNALSPVALYTETLLEQEPHLSARARAYLTTIQRAMDDVTATLARLREFSRQREPQRTLAPVHVNHLAQQVVDLTRARWRDIAQQRGIAITMVTALTPDLPVIMGVESEIRDALINLIFNAVDAMPDGGTLTLRTHTTAGASEAGETSVLSHVHVEVADTGTGMSAETQRRCLEPFFTTKGERGTGLGLAMVYGMVQRHSADIAIDSTPGQGTTVRLSFPARTPVTTGSPAPVVAQAAPSRLRVLIVDDDPLVLQVLRDTLESDGHVVESADGGRAGIEVFRMAQARGEPFAVVITDLGMPAMDGRQVASAVKTAAPSTPVVLLTGWGQRMAAEGEMPSYVDYVLGKPPKLRELREVLAHCGQPG